jgi:hypothetical protein
MKIAIRTYYGKNDKKLFDLMEKHQAEVNQLMGSIEGLVSYTLARNSLGGFSVTVCKDKHGILKSIKTKQNFIAQHASDLNIAAMQIIEGEVITHLDA